MSTTGPEPPRNGNATEPSRSGRTSGSRWSLVLGALVAFVAAIEAVLKGLSGVLERVNDLFKNAKGLTDTLGLHWSTSWIAIAILGLVGIWLLYLGSRRKSRLLRPEARIDPRRRPVSSAGTRRRRPGTRQDLQQPLPGFPGRRVGRGKVGADTRRSVSARWAPYRVRPPARRGAGRGLDQRSFRPAGPGDSRPQRGRIDETGAETRGEVGRHSRGGQAIQDENSAVRRS